ncbi:hypothetical protein [Chitinophaga sp. S165]|uniref:hypothetical protein n=1 Tax=Chitinophaga sp. S165 TaxID=2135462 RepID=UPI000D713B91|nr:hypothetical protein [Chitinophaga sp. S165]PWV45889.1 hypothetical protein C7475_112106 [Chitinophaga sp. S165]
MGNKSFYDLDYIIEINEQRLEQYANAHQKSVERFTTLLVIYSALCIFLVPIIQTLFFTKEQWHWSYYCSFYVFCILFSISIVNCILLLSPVSSDVLRAPRIYYRELKENYEEAGILPQKTDTIIKNSYIVELENAINKNENKLQRKFAYYNRAFHYAILACIPYLHCIWMQINYDKKTISKSEISTDLSSFTKNQSYMWKWKKKPKFKEIDEVMLTLVKYGGLGGVHPKDIIRVEPIHGKMYWFGFVPNKFQPKPMHEILLEQLRERKRNSRT